MLLEKFFVFDAEIDEKSHKKLNLSAEIRVFRVFCYIVLKNLRKSLFPREKREKQEKNEKNEKKTRKTDKIQVFKQYLEIILRLWHKYLAVYAEILRKNQENRAETATKLLTFKKIEEETAEKRDFFCEIGKKLSLTDEIEEFVRLFLESLYFEAINMKMRGNCRDFYAFSQNSLKIIKGLAVSRVNLLILQANFLFLLNFINFLR